jgi:hypothetical protein
MGRKDRRIKATAASHAAIALSLIPPTLLFSSPLYHTSDEQPILRHISREHLLCFTTLHERKQLFFATLHERKQRSYLLFSSLLFFATLHQSKQHSLK